MYIIHASEDDRKSLENVTLYLYNIDQEGEKPK